MGEPNQLVVKDDTEVQLEQMNRLCSKLMQTKHFAKMGEVGVMAIVSKAQSLNINPMDALNGALYFVQGKVEMGAQTMNRLIRQVGHSIKKDPKSNNNICILHGKRKDNGDTWTESFSLEEAKAAGLYSPGKPSAWTKYPRDMLFNRALSRLARQLFPDVIKGCYIEGEIKDAPDLNAPVLIEEEAADMQEIELISLNQSEELWEMCKGREEVKEKVKDFLSKQNKKSLEDLPVEWYERLKKSIENHVQEKEVEEEAEKIEEEEAVMDLEPIQLNEPEWFEEE